MNKKKFYITTPIYYPSGKPHLGTAYTTTLVDVINRYKKLIGFDSFMLTGLDEHGQKLEEKSIKEGFKSPQEYVDSMVHYFTELFEKLDIKYDKFIRTSDKYHVDSVQKIFSEMYKNKNIYLGNWESLYCVGCEATYTESDALKKDDGYYCPLGHGKLSKKNEESYFFKMNKYSSWLKKYYKDHPELSFPETRLNEMLNNFIDKGLEDLSISRTTFNWGIQILENKKHIIYVWLDALFNYVTALGFKQKDNKLYKKYWEDKNSEVVHVIGKDIARFHLIYWPIMLNSIGIRIPSKEIVHGFYTAEDGSKMSKSLGNVIDPEELINNYGSDIVRYYMMKEFVITEDNPFSMKKFVELFNSDLANIYGNIVSRVNKMLELYQNKTVLKPTKNISNNIKEMLKVEKKILSSVEKNVNTFNIRGLLNDVCEYGNSINLLIEQEKPWELSKNNEKEKLTNLLFYLTNCIRIYTILLSPVLVKGVEKIKTQMNFSTSMLEYKNIKKGELIIGLKVKECSPIYQRIANKK